MLDSAQGNYKFNSSRDYTQGNSILLSKTNQHDYQQQQPPKPFSVISGRWGNRSYCTRSAPYLGSHPCNKHGWTLLEQRCSHLTKKN